MLNTSDVYSERTVHIVGKKGKYIVKIVVGSYKIVVGIHLWLMDDSDGGVSSHRVVKKKNKNK